MEAEGTCMISARKFTISCHFRMISEGTSIKFATLERSMFLGSDGEGSITTPVAVCDSSHGRPNRRYGQTSKEINAQLDDLAGRINAFSSLALYQMEQIRVKYRPAGLWCNVPFVWNIPSLNCFPVRTASLTH